MNGNKILGDFGGGASNGTGCVEWLVWGGGGGEEEEEEEEEEESYSSCAVNEDSERDRATQV
jgi:hypothetical protein